MIKVSLIIAALLISLTGATAHAGPNYLAGNITLHTTLVGGMLIMLSTGVPDNCNGTPAGWMYIPESNKTMVAMTIAAIINDKKYVVVYTNGYPDPSGYCVINQVQTTF